MNWEAFFGVIFICGMIAVLCFAGYWGLQFVCWSYEAIHHRFGEGWADALFVTYIVLGVALMVGLESNE